MLDSKLDITTHSQGLTPVAIYVRTTVISVGAGAAVAILERITVETFSNLSVVFLIPILYSAIYYGTLPAIFSSIFSLFIFDYFFIPPLFTLSGESIDNLIKFVVFILTSIITSILAGKVRSYALSLKEKEHKISLLYALGERMADTSTIEDVVIVAEEFLKETLNLTASIIIPQSYENILFDLLGDNSSKAYAYALEHGVNTGKCSPHFPEVNELYIPLKTGQRITGVLQIEVSQDQRPIQNIDVFATQIAIGIERTLLHEAKEQALLEKERESLRSALLSSVSHDLKTPLSAIIAAGSMLLVPDKELGEFHSKIIAHTIVDEAKRLNQFIINLLEITKLESGAILLNAEPVNLDDIIDATIKRIRERIEHHHIRVELPNDLPMISLDPTLMQHVFMNLLENAAKYSEKGTEIIIRSYIQDGSFIVEIEDEGCGIPTEDLTKVFDKFYRARRTDSQVAGTGLGLPICHSIVAVHGGTIAILIPAKNRGTLVRIILPSKLGMKELGEMPHE